MQNIRTKVKKWLSAIIFFDFKKADDNMPKNILIHKLIKINVPYNIVAVVHDMLDKLWLDFNGRKIRDHKDVVRESTLYLLHFKLVY